MIEKMIIGLILLLVGFVGWGVWEELHAEHFSLRKDAWVCMASHSEMSTLYVQVGSVLVPQTRFESVCDNWSRR